MNSMYKPTVKVLLASIAITACVGMSVFATVKEAQANSQPAKTEAKVHTSKKQNYHPKSQYERWLHRDLSMLIPGSRQFNPRFLSALLNHNLTH